MLCNSNWSLALGLFAPKYTNATLKLSDIKFLAQTPKNLQKKL